MNETLLLLAVLAVVALGIAVDYLMFRWTGYTAIEHLLFGRELRRLKQIP